MVYYAHPPNTHPKTDNLKPQMSAIVCSLGRCFSFSFWGIFRFQLLVSWGCNMTCLVDVLMPSPNRCSIILEVLVLVTLALGTGASQQKLVEVCPKKTGIFASPKLTWLQVWLFWVSMLNCTGVQITKSLAFIRKVSYVCGGPYSTRCS